MKRLTALLALLVLLLGSGCGKAGQNSPACEPEGEASEEKQESMEISALENKEAAAAVSTYEPEDTELVRLRDYMPELIINLRYASEDNFTGQRLYDFSGAYLRYGTVKKLMRVQERLSGYGCQLIIWDAYRPRSAQLRFWELMPDPLYVADPTKGNSTHSNGGTLDLTMADGEGRELNMPSGFDEFSALADRDYSDVSPEKRENALLLERIMEEEGFEGYFGEWWHFSDKREYEFTDLQPLAPYAGKKVKIVGCQEFISLRCRPDTEAELICELPLGAEAELAGGCCGDFLTIIYEGQRGYALASYIESAE